jgi:small subunit ribosomal protein S18
MVHPRRPPPPPISGKFCDDPKLDYKDTTNLRRFLTAHGQILSRKRTGYCAQCQKELKQAVKRARHLALLPFVA